MALSQNKHDAWIYFEVAAGAITTAATKAKGCNVTRSTTGSYVVTLDKAIADSDLDCKARAYTSTASVASLVLVPSDTATKLFVGMFQLATSNLTTYDIVSAFITFDRMPKL